MLLATMDTIECRHGVLMNGRDRNMGVFSEALQSTGLLAVCFCIAVELLFRSVDEATLELFLGSLLRR